MLGINQNQFKCSYPSFCGRFIVNYRINNEHLAGEKSSTIEQDETALDYLDKVFQKSNNEQTYNRHWEIEDGLGNYIKRINNGLQIFYYDNKRQEATDSVVSLILTEDNIDPSLKEKLKNRIETLDKKIGTRPFDTNLLKDKTEKSIKYFMELLFNQTK